MKLKAEGWGEQVNYLGSDLQTVEIVSQRWKADGGDAVRTETLIIRMGLHRSSAGEDEKRRRRCREKWDSRHPWRVSILLLTEKTREEGGSKERRQTINGGFRCFYWRRRREKTEEIPWGARESSSFVVGFDPSSVTEKTRLKTEDRWWKSGGGFRSVVGFDPSSVTEKTTRGERRRRIGGGGAVVGFDRDQFRAFLCHGEDDKTRTKPEERWWVSIEISFDQDQFRSFVSSVTENTRRREDKKEKKDIKENRKRNTYPTLPTRVSNNTLKTGHKIPHLRIGDNSLFFCFDLIKSLIILKNPH